MARNKYTALADHAAQLLAEAVSAGKAEQGKTIFQVVNDGDEGQIAVVGNQAEVLEDLIEAMREENAVAELIVTASKLYREQHCDCPACQAKRSKTAAVPMTPPSDNIIN